MKDCCDFMRTAQKLLIAGAFVLIAFPTHKLAAQQWHLVESGVTSDLYDIQFVDKNTGWAVGEDSTIIKTTDGGHTWFRQTGGVAEEYRCVYFWDANLGWIGGTGGLVLHTTDGGSTWVRQATGNADFINAIDFVNDSVGWLAVENYNIGQLLSGSILKTTNGGGTWFEVLHTPYYRSNDSVSLDSMVLGEFQDIDFVDEMNGCVGSAIYSDRGKFLGSVMVTSDGGMTWRDISTWNTWIDTRCVTMFSPDTIFAGTLDGLAFTYNGGDTYFDWVEPLFTGVYDMYIAKDKGAIQLSLHHGAYGVIFRDRIGSAYRYEYLEGEVRQSPTANPNHMGLHMFTLDTGWVCGDSGKLWSKPEIVNGVEYLQAVNSPLLCIVEMYPNPIPYKSNHAVVVVQSESRIASEIDFYIYNVLGVEECKSSHTVVNGYNEVRFDVASLPRGVYMIGFKSGRGYQPAANRGNMIFVVK